MAAGQQTGTPPQPFQGAALRHFPTVAPECDSMDGLPPRKRLVILSSPRTGSNLLSEWLRLNGFGLGVEYLESAAMEAFARARSLGVLRLDQYLEIVATRRKSPNGIFVLKIHLPHLLTLAASAALEPLPLAIALLSTSDLVVAVTRADKLQQASSLSIAESTGQYAAFMKTGRTYEPGPMDSIRLLESLRAIRLWDRMLQEVVDATERPVLALTYEELAERPESVLRRVLEALGEPAAERPRTPGLRRQRSAINEAMERNFLRWLEGSPLGVEEGAQVTP